LVLVTAQHDNGLVETGVLVRRAFGELSLQLGAGLAPALVTDGLLTLWRRR
jgi:hypothetical protein